MPHSPAQPPVNPENFPLKVWLLAGLLASAGCIPTPHVPPAESGFATAGRAILVDGEPVLFRGICYQPTPIGEDPRTAPPYGDYYTGEYRDLHERDLPLMRAMGCNLIRVYGWDPAADHSAFLDRCYRGGDQPIYVLINRWIDPSTDWNDPAAVDAIRDNYLAMVPEARTHPAVLGFLLGNEANIQEGNGENPAFWQAHNRIAGALQEAAPGKLVSMAITDAVPSVQEFDDTMAHLDFWSLQIYRGPTFGKFFEEYVLASNKPLLITEFGMDAFDSRIGREFPDNATYPAAVIVDLWQEIVANRHRCSGGALFAWNDEWWKSEGTPDQQDPGGFPSGGYIDKTLNEEWWGLFRVRENGKEPDRLSPRAAYGALKALWQEAPGGTK